MSTTSTIPPYADEWLAAEALSGGRFVLHGTVPEIREQFNSFFAATKSLLPPPTSDVEKAYDKTLEGIDVCTYTPKNLPANAPTGLYIHSGGWTCGSIEHEDHLCRKLALDVPCRLVSVEYRLAPEYPFPAALDDCVSAYKWMVNNNTPSTEPPSSSSAEKKNTSKFFILGGSAGGNLTLTTTLALLDSSIPIPRAIFPLCPSTCLLSALPHLSPSLASFSKPASHYADAAAITKSTIKTCGEAYTSGPHNNTAPTNPLISPIFHSKLGHLPPVYLTTSNKDPLNDDAEMLKFRLDELGVRSEMREYDGYPHFFHAVPILKMTGKFLEELGEGVRGWVR